MLQTNWGAVFSAACTFITVCTCMQDFRCDLHVGIKLSSMSKLRNFLRDQSTKIRTLKNFLLYGLFNKILVVTAVLVCHFFFFLVIGHEMYKEKFYKMMMRVMETRQQ